MKDSHTLDRVDVRDTGRSLSREGVGLTLGSGTTVASLHCVGTTPERREVYISQWDAKFKKRTPLGSYLVVGAGLGMC